MSLTFNYRSYVTLHVLYYYRVAEVSTLASTVRLVFDSWQGQKYYFTT